MQIAIKSSQGDFTIANYLLDCGANVNFMETEGCNEWRMPVIQDAIMAAIFCSRWMIEQGYSPEIAHKKFIFKNTIDVSNDAYKLMLRMFNMGADINARDSFGNSCLHRAILDARQFLPTYNYSSGELLYRMPFNSELKEDFKRILIYYYLKVQIYMILQMCFHYLLLKNMIKNLFHSS